MKPHAKKAWDELEAIGMTHIPKYLVRKTVHGLIEEARLKLATALDTLSKNLRFKTEALRQAREGIQALELAIKREGEKHD